MPLYDLDRGGTLIDADDIFKGFVEPVAKRLDKRTFVVMVRTVDTELRKLKPSKSSSLVWTKCAALCGYQSDLSSKYANHLWKHAADATTFDPDGCNKFVGSLIMWRIALLPQKWLSTKTLDRDGVHPYRTYWINDVFVPQYIATAQDLVAKFNTRHS